jgi:hypothetical protein
MKNFFLFFIALFPAFVVAQIKFEATTERTTYALNENIQIAFEMNVDGDNFQLPKIEGFRVDGPFLMMQNYNINGRRGFLKTYKYFLTPTKMGNFVINEAQMEYGGKVYRTEDIRIKITKAIPQQQRNPNQGNPNNQYYDPFDDPFFNQQQPQRQAPTNYGEGIFIVPEISNSNPYVGQPLQVVYRIYFDPRVQIGNISDIKKPKYNGFWSNFSDVNRPAVATQYKGKTYAMAVLGTATIYPLESGKKPIEPFSFEAEVQYPTTKVDVFGDPIMAMTRKKLTSGTQIINVKALPLAGKPADFSGAVGNLSFSVTTDKTKLKSGEALKLKLETRGKGNLKLFSLPKPVVSAAMELYDPEHAENVQTPLSGMVGAISDTYTIVPQYKGNYQIKPITFSYFDLESKSYKTITSQPITIEVLDGPNFATANTKNFDKQKKEIARKFASVASVTELQPINPTYFLGSTKFYILFFLPFLLIPIVVLLRKRKEISDADFAGNRIKNSKRLVKKYLSEAKKQQANKEKFYIALERAMHNFLKAKLSIETFDMSKSKIEEILLSRNVEPNSVDQFITLTENCEIARFAPATSVSIQNDFDIAIAILSDLEKQIKPTA